MNPQKTTTASYRCRRKNERRSLHLALVVKLAGQEVAATLLRQLTCPRWYSARLDLVTPEGRKRDSTFGPCSDRSVENSHVPGTYIHFLLKTVRVNHGHDAAVNWTDPITPACAPQEYFRREGAHAPPKTPLRAFGGFNNQGTSMVLCNALRLWQ